jgi:hypothetical protein
MAISQKSCQTTKQLSRDSLSTRTNEISKASKSLGRTHILALAFLCDAHKFCQELVWIGTEG